MGITLSTSKKDEMLRKEALEYHEAEPQGKIKVVPHQTTRYGSRIEPGLLSRRGVSVP